MTEFVLPKNDGTSFIIKGEALTEVYADGTRPSCCSVIQLKSGEKILYVYSRPAHELSNAHVSVQQVYRKADQMTAFGITEACGTKNNMRRIFDALDVQQFTVIE